MTRTLTEASRPQLDAIELLMQDHREVESLFMEFEYLRSKDEDADHVVESACAEIRTHDVLKSELFCPAVFEALDTPDMRDLLAQVEQGRGGIRELTSRLEEVDQDPAQRDAQFRLLRERVESQFELAETQIFPRAKRAERLDLASVANRMKARRNEIVKSL